MNMEKLDHYKGRLHKCLGSLADVNYTTVKIFNEMLYDNEVNCAEDLSEKLCHILNNFSKGEHLLHGFLNTIAKVQLEKPTEHEKADGVA